MDNKDKDFVIHFEPAEDTRKRALGWGTGMLTLFGEPYWFGEKDGAVEPFEWTWTDLLGFLAINWNELLFEEAYPFPWLPQAARSINSVWKLAEERWEELPPEKIEAEEHDLITYFERHNLALAWKGAALPELMCLRSGKQMWLTGKDEKPRMISFEKFEAEVTAFGDSIASALKGSTDANVLHLLDLWKHRTELSAERKILITTSLPIDTLKLIQRDAANGYWMRDGEFDEELLVAARMVRNHLGPEAIRGVLDVVKDLQKQSTPELDALTKRFEACTLLSRDQRPYEQGYEVAAWARAELNLAYGELVDAETILKRFNVFIGEVRFGTSALEALAVWGSRGPAVLLNTSLGKSAKRRTAIAHEFCHLIVDQTRMLPAAEVLGGSVDLHVEQRARAFAAEFLLPRQLVLDLRRRYTSIETFVARLARRFQVSKQVVLYQIENSGLGLTGEETRWLQRQQSVARTSAAFAAL
jgi:Zn-dependent peptidase ImmA (M78 family)